MHGPRLASPRAGRHDGIMARARDTQLAVLARDLSVGHPAGRDVTERAVDGVSFELPFGASIAVMGPTGAGKSTLAAALTGSKPAMPILGGEAWVLDLPVRRLSRMQRRTLGFHTGYLSQSAGATLAPTLTVGELIAEPLTSRDRRLNHRALALRVATLLDEMQLPLGAAAKFPYELSAGMRQRVAVARALVLAPKLFIGDEPLAALDIEVRGAVIAALQRRRDEYGMASVLVTNDADLVHAVDASVLVLRHGMVVAQGPRDAVRWSPSVDADPTLLAR